ncbi:hypothetical protein B6I21_04985 [candidate division KSB1 bacterium 4572_119]|nr:MAG: hypothetical protein B6I21_04985 [candidate division KSB1 bacterium 4572_119]
MKCIIKTMFQQSSREFLLKRLKWTKYVKREQPAYLRFMLFLMIIYISFVYLFTLTPFQFSKFYFFQYLLFKKGYLAGLTGTTSFKDFIINLFMLFPVGFLSASIFKGQKLSFKLGLITTVLIGFLISLTIETLQVFLPRVTSAIDIINNTSGAAIGAVLVYSIRTYDPPTIYSSLREKWQTFYKFILVVYGLIIFALFLTPTLLNNFRSWDTNFPLLIGNENSMDRPWQGQIFRLSIYDECLSYKEIKKFFTSNNLPPESIEIKYKPLCDYFFQAFPIKNRGELGGSYDLHPQKYSTAFYLAKQSGLFIKHNSLVKSIEHDSLLIKRLKKSNRLSILLWCQPTNLHQFGPARIVSHSINPTSRNFTIGQEGARINFRVRTGLTGSNGSKLSLLSPLILTPNNPSFIALTFYRGETKLYFNGKLTNTTIHDTSFYLPLIFGLEKSRFRIIEIYFTLLFPFGWLLLGIPAINWKNKIYFSFFFFLPFIFSAAIKSVIFQHALDTHLLAIHLVLYTLLLLTWGFFEIMVFLFINSRLALKSIVSI